MSRNDAGSRGLWTELRECATWLSSPAAYASVQIARRPAAGSCAGPFAGMLYPRGLVPRGLFPGPYVAGSFECELDPIIEEIIAAEPEVLVNVGSAQGYYAVGLGRAVWEMAVIAYEADPVMRAAARRIALLNEVEPRVDARGLCTRWRARRARTPARGSLGLRGHGLRGGGGRAGRHRRGALARAASLLVELHGADGADGGSRPLLERRLRGSHELRIVHGEPRWASRFPELWSVHGLRQIDRELVVAEYRQGIGEWLWAVPKRAAGDRRPGSLPTRPRRKELRCRSSRRWTQFKETEGGEAFRLQNSKLLKVELAGESRSRRSWARWSPTRATCASSTRARAGSRGC